MNENENVAGPASIKPAVRPSLTKTRTTDRHLTSPPSNRSQGIPTAFALRDFPSHFLIPREGCVLQGVVEITLDRYNYEVLTVTQGGSAQKKEYHVVHRHPDIPASQYTSWRLDEGCRFIESLNLDPKVPPFALFETVIEGGHEGEVVYTAVPFSHTIKTRQPIDTSHFFPLTQICGKSTLAYLPPRQYDRRIRHGIAGRMTTKRADIPVFYTLGTSVELWGRRHEVWAYWLKLEKGEVQAYHHNSLEVPANALRCVCTLSLFGVTMPDKIILWQIDDMAHLPLESSMHRFEILGETRDLIEIYQVSSHLVVFAYKDRLVRYHLAKMLLEEQYSIELPRQPNDIVFLGAYACLVHPEKLVILDLSTGLEFQLVTNPVTDGNFRVLDHTKGGSGRCERPSGMILSAGRDGDPPKCFKLQILEEPHVSADASGAACLAL